MFCRSDAAVRAESAGASRMAGELCLGKGDLAIHTVETWKGSERFLPEDGGCDGFILHMDLKKLTEQPPELFTGTDITGEFLFDRFCAGRRRRCRKAVIGRRASLPGFIRGRMATAPAGSG